MIDYVNKVNSTSKLFGSTFYRVSQTSDLQLPQTLILAVNAVGLHLQARKRGRNRKPMLDRSSNWLNWCIGTWMSCHFDPQNLESRQLLASYPYEHIVRWGRSTAALNIILNDGKCWSFGTRQGEEINKFIGIYVKKLVEKRTGNSQQQRWWRHTRWNHNSSENIIITQLGLLIVVLITLFILFQFIYFLLLSALKEAKTSLGVHKQSNEFMYAAFHSTSWVQFFLFFSSFWGKKKTKVNHHSQELSTMQPGPGQARPSQSQTDILYVYTRRLESVNTVHDNNKYVCQARSAGGIFSTQETGYLVLCALLGQQV